MDDARAIIGPFYLILSRPPDSADFWDNWAVRAAFRTPWCAKPRAHARHSDLGNRRRRPTLGHVRTIGLRGYGVTCHCVGASPAASANIAELASTALSVQTLRVA